MEAFGMTLYEVKDVVKKVGKRLHKSEGRGIQKRLYSYCGVRAMMQKCFPDKRPSPRGAYMPLESLEQANTLMDGRPRAEGRYVEGRQPETVEFFGKQIISLEAYAEYRGYSLANIRNIVYDDTVPFAELFTLLRGGFLLTELEFGELVKWIKTHGSGPTPLRRKRRYEGTPLNTARTSLAYKDKEGTE